MTKPCEPSAAERARYARSPEGAVYTTSDNGGAALFYSAIRPIGPEQLNKVYCSARMDGTMRTIVRAHPLAEQVYVNTFDSMNRIVGSSLGLCYPPTGPGIGTAVPNVSSPG